MDVLVEQRAHSDWPGCSDPDVAGQHGLTSAEGQQYIYFGVPIKRF